jgi:hypothetical protein
LTHPSVNRTDPPIQKLSICFGGKYAQEANDDGKTEVIRRLRLGHSIRHINKSTGMHRTLIRRLKDLAQQHLWLESEEPVPDEATIKALLDPPASNSNAEHPLDPYRSDIAKWLKEEYSYVVIHQLLSPMVPVSESTVRRYCQKHFPQAPRGTHLRDTIPGEIMEVGLRSAGDDV